MAEQTNPLQEFFRKPAYKILLPSGGRYWPPGSLSQPGTEPLDVYPMTALDCIAYQAPSSLLNGEILVPVIQSCIPAIQDAWSIPACDLLTVIVGLHIATYGHTAQVNGQCTACHNAHAISIDLAAILDTISHAVYQDLELDNLLLQFHPLTYRQISSHGSIESLHEKTLRVLSDESVSEQIKSQQLNNLLKSIMAATISVMNHSVKSITANGVTVTDPQDIERFVKNCTREIFIQVKDHIVAFKESTENHAVSAQCPKCRHTYQHRFDTDQIRFAQANITGLEIFQ